MRMMTLFQRVRARQGQAGQVATYMVLWVAMLMLLGTVTMNIGEVALVRTRGANAADKAALQLASSLGAIARQTCYQIDKSGRCDTQCGDLGESLLNLFLDSLIPVIGTIIATIDLQDATFGQDHQNRSINEQIIESSLPQRAQLREQSILSAMSDMVDDPRVEEDINDIDRDGETTEMISAFSVWFSDRIDREERRGQTRREEVKEMMLYLAGTWQYDRKPFSYVGTAPQDEGFLQVSRRFRAFLRDEFGGPNGFMEQLEDNGQSVSWWLRNSADGIPGPELPVISADRIPPVCDPSVDGTCPSERPVVPDEVDWLGSQENLANPPLPGTPHEFEEWIDRLARMGPKKRIKRLDSWEPQLKESWDNSIRLWDAMIGDWLTSLNAIAVACPACEAPGGPITMTTARERLQAYRDLLNFLAGKITDFAGKMPSRFNPVYSWWDSRGNHHVKVKVHKFKVPQLYHWREFLVRCVRVRYRETGEDGVRPVKIVTWRYDEDRQVSRPWTFRIRRNPEDNLACDADDDPEDCQDILAPEDNASAEQYGLFSSGSAKYSWQRDDIKLQVSR